MQPAFTNTQTQFERYALTVSARAEVKQLTKTQERAIDLYKRGFNVFPLPYGSKKPFKNTSLKRLYNSRLHLCGDGIEPCRHAGKTFASLFTGRKNIAAVCGKTSGNLLDIDCDSNTAYERMGKELDTRDLSYWAFTSHRGGGYLLRVMEGEAANVTKAKSLFSDVELWGNSHYAVMPMSVHPSGTVYRWRGDGDPRFQFATAYETLPAVSVTALTWLGVTLLKDDKPQPKPFETFGLPAIYSPLSKRNREMLAHGTSEGERNARLTALAYDMAGCGLEYDEIESDFLQSASMSNPPYSQRNASAILKSAYSKERTRARKDNNTGEPDARIQRLYSFVNSYDWKAVFGRKARTRRAVFMGCVARSAIEGETFRASVREMGETVNRKFQYVGVCLRDLVDAKLLRLVEPWHKSVSGGNVYAFGDAVTLPPILYSSTTTCNTNVNYWGYSKNTNSDAWKDVFGRLGDVAGRVFRALQQKKYKSAYAIAKDTGEAHTSVDRAVKRLVTHGLVIHSEAEGLYYAEPVNEAELFALSVRLQANGRAELQRIQHKIDRELFNNRNLLKAMQAYDDITGERR